MLGEGTFICRPIGTSDDGMALGKPPSDDVSLISVGSLNAGDNSEMTRIEELRSELQAIEYWDREFWAFENPHTDDKIACLHRCWRRLEITTELLNPRNMSFMMEISRKEVRSLFQKWQGERRLIQCGLFYADGSSCAVIGRIEHLDAESVRIDARTGDIAGQHYGLALKFSDVICFHIKETPEAHYENFICAELQRGCTCEIHAVKLHTESLASYLSFYQPG